MAMLGSLGDLVLSLSADTARFQSDLGRGQRIAEKFSHNVGRSIANVAGALIALGGAASLGGLIKSAIDTSDELSKMSEKVGMSVEALSSLRVQAKLADVDTETLKQGFIHLANNANLVALGVGQNAKYAFEQLGIAVNDQSGKLKSTQQLWDEATTKLAAMHDGSQKTGIAMALLGRSGAELLPLINNLKEGSREAQELGLVIDGKTGKAAEAFNDNLTLMGFAVQSIGLQIAKAMLPELNKYGDEMVAAAKDTNNWSEVARGASATLKVFATIANVAWAGFKVLGEGIGSVAAAIMAVAHGDFAGAMAIIKENSADAAKAEQDAASRIADIWEETGSSIQAKSAELGRKLASPAFEAKDLATQAANDAQKAWQQVWAFDDQQQADEIDRAQTTLQEKEAIDAQAAADHQKMMEQIWAFDDAQAEADMERAQTTARELEENSKKTGDAARQLGLTFESAFEDAAVQGKSLRDVLQGLAQDIARIMLRKSVTEPLANAASSIFGDMFKGLFGGGKAEGGPVSPGKFYLVGEHGPEILAPATHSTIVPTQHLAGAAAPTVVNNINFSATTPAALRDAMYSMLPTITNATKAAMIDAKNRGALPAFR